jgi:hypothetical protein
MTILSVGQNNAEATAYAVTAFVNFKPDFKKSLRTNFHKGRVAFY